jgi:hypothetical protein
MLYMRSLADRSCGSASDASAAGAENKPLQHKRSSKLAQVNAYIGYVRMVGALGWRGGSWRTGARAGLVHGPDWCTGGRADGVHGPDGRTGARGRRVHGPDGCMEGRVHGKPLGAVALASRLP